MSNKTELTRVNAAITEHILAYYEPGKVFRMSDLTRFVGQRVSGYIAPDSPGRIMRSLKAKGRINYELKNRSQSLYKFTALVTSAHLDSARHYFRGEGGRPYSRTEAAKYLAKCSDVGGWPAGTEATWDAAIGQLVADGVLNQEGGRVQFVVADHARNATDTQMGLF